MTVYESTLKQVREGNFFLGRIFMIGILYPLQIQPIDGKPFILENSIIPFIKMVSLKRSVCASGNEFVETQSIFRKDYNKFDSDP